MCVCVCAYMFFLRIGSLQAVGDESDRFDVSESQPSLPYLVRALCLKAVCAYMTSLSFSPSLDLD